MPKTVFAPGMPLTAAVLNAINNPVFDGADADGHRPKITDAELADNGIKSVVSAYRDGLRVFHEYDRVVRILPGTYTDSSGMTATYSGGLFSISPNVTRIVHLRVNGTIGFTPPLPPVCIPLAQVVSNDTTILSITDLRPRISMMPIPRLVSMFGGNGSEKALIVAPTGTPGWDSSNNTYTAIGNDAVPFVLNGTHNYTNFTVQLGAKIQSEGLHIKTTGTATVAGTIEVTPMINGGAGYSGTFLIPSDIRSNVGAGFGASGGHNTTPLPYDYQVSNVGSGGGSGYCKGRLTGGGNFSDISDTCNVVVGTGGNGGNSLIIESAGAITISGTLMAVGGHASNNNYISGLGANQYVIMSGAGGGSGGLIHLKSVTSVTLTPTSSVDIRGGDGGNGFVSSNVSGTFTARGGGGGSGGYLVLESPNNNNQSVSFINLGGFPGLPSGSGSNILSGCPGASYASLGGNSGTNGSSGQIKLITI